VQSAAKLKHIEPNKKTNEVDSWATIFSESERRIEKTLKKRHTWKSKIPGYQNCVIVISARRNKKT
jgi:hypothetical protein